MQRFFAKLSAGRGRSRARKNGLKAPGTVFSAAPDSAVADDSRLQRANELLEKGDYGRAETILRQLVAESPEEPEYLTSLALCLALGPGKFVTAEKLAQRAKRLAPHRGCGWFALGYINLLGSRLEKGYLYLNEGRRRAPRDPRLDYGLEIWHLRRPPVISDLGHEHLVNRVLGLLRRIVTDRRVIIAGSGWVVYRALGMLLVR
jgi:tetratricopeptide (TPR) repeat protein